MMRRRDYPVLITCMLSPALFAAKLHISDLGLTGLSAETLEDLDLDLDSFLSFPARGELAGCSDEASGLNRVAWTESYAGVNNVFVAQASTQNSWTKFLVTNFTKSSGLDCPFIQFNSLGVTAPCTQLFFSFGPTAGVNPTSSTKQPQFNTYVSEWSSRVGAVPKPAFPLNKFIGLGLITLPDGRAAVSYEENSVLFGQAAGDSPVELFSVSLGMFASVAAHPRIHGAMAFSNIRGATGGHGFIGVYSPSSDVITWLSPSLDMDTNPVWNSKGSQVAFVRQVELEDAHGRVPFHQGSAFGIMIANVTVDGPGGHVMAAGARTIFRDWKYGFCDNDCGFGVRPVIFSPDDSEVLFGTEALPTAQGFLHVAAASIWGDIRQGEVSVRDLTPVVAPGGQGCETQDWVLGADQWLYIAHNCDNRETLSISRVQVIAATPSLKQPPRQSVVPGTPFSISGMAEVTVGMVPMFNGIAYLGSTYNTPPSVYFLALSSSMPPIANSSVEVSPLDPKMYPRFNNQHFVKPTTTILKGGPFDLSMHVFNQNSSHAVPSSQPAILFTHGGSQRQMYGAFHYCTVYAQLFALNQYLASKGFVVLSLNYRSGVGYGYNFRVCPNCGYWGGAEYEDVLAGGLWLGDQPTVDKTRVGVYGLSYGGLNTLQALTRNSDIFSCGVANAPVFNWISIMRYAGFPSFDESPPLNWGFHQLPTGPLPDFASPTRYQVVQDNIKLGWNSSPASQVGNLTSPLLLIHGDLDNEVDFQESRGMQRLTRRLLGEKVSDELIETLVFPDEMHGLALYQHQLQAAQATADFMQQHLMQRKKK